MSQRKKVEAEKAELEQQFEVQARLRDDYNKQLKKVQQQLKECQQDAEEARQSKEEIASSYRELDRRFKFIKNILLFTLLK